MGEASYTSASLAQVETSRRLASLEKKKGKYDKLIGLFKINGLRTKAMIGTRHFSVCNASA
jgi:hypothetical protein